MKQKIMNIALAGINSTSPVRLVESVVMSDNPISIMLGNNRKMILSRDVLVIAEHLTRHTRQIRVNGGAEQTYEFMDELKTGDKVMVAVVQGGQSFFIIDRV